jgi:probable HAF family extracellular repeat protein
MMFRSVLARGAWTIASVLFAIGEVHAAGMYHVTDLGTSRGAKLNNAGQVITNDYHGSMPVLDPGNSVPASYNIALRYSGYGSNPGQVERIGDNSTWAVDINDSGQMLVQSGNDYVLTDGTSVTPLGLRSGKGMGIAVNNGGQVLGTGFTQPDGSTTGLAISQGGQVTTLGLLPGARAVWATALNNSGQAAGATAFGDVALGVNTNHATLWLNGKPQDLGTLGGPQSSATGLNDAGTVVGYAYVSPTSWHAIAFKSGKMTDLGTLPGGLASQALGINNAGDIVGTSSLSGSTLSHAFIFHNGQMQDLNTLIGQTLGWTLTSAISINAMGQILAVGRDMNTGWDHAVLLTPDGVPIPADPIPAPEPTTFAVLTLGLGALALLRRRARLTI